MSCGVSYMRMREGTSKGKRDEINLLFRLYFPPPLHYVSLCLPTDELQGKVVS